MILASSILNYSGITILNAATKKQVPADLGAVTASDIVAGILLVGLSVAAYLLAKNYRYLQGAYIGIIAVGIYLMAAPYIFDLLKVASYLGMDKPNTNDQLIGIVAVIVGGFALQSHFQSAETVENSTLPAAI